MVEILDARPSLSRCGNETEGSHDLDGDGHPNCVDIDSDGDRITDKVEAQEGSDPFDATDVPNIPVPLAVWPMAAAALCAGLLALRKLGRRKESMRRG